MAAPVGSADSGEKLFKGRCAQCHTVEKVLLCPLRVQGVSCCAVLSPSVHAPLALFIDPSLTAILMLLSRAVVTARARTSMASSAARPAPCPRTSTAMPTRRAASPGATRRSLSIFSIPRLTSRRRTASHLPAVQALPRIILSLRAISCLQFSLVPRYSISYPSP